MISLIQPENRTAAVVEQFDRDSYGYVSKHLTSLRIRENQRILKLIETHKKHRRVLDIGCGPGIICKDLLKLSDFVWGIDISPGMVRAAAKWFEGTVSNSRIRFEVGNAESLQFPDEHFDVVCCVGVLRYLNSLENGLQEIYRVLKPGGTFVATFYYRFSLNWFSSCFMYRPLLPMILLAKSGSFRGCSSKYKAEPLPFSYRKFKKIFHKIGFQRLETQHSGFDFFPLNRLFPRLSSWIYLKAESKLYNSNRLGWLGSICVVKGEKRSASTRSG
jgi:demethylmenaquinone methyltransferase / 2-methoxy-6-polyprenyl-1,4-benzoquinol methylase